MLNSKNIALLLIITVLADCAAPQRAVQPGATVATAVKDICEMRLGRGANADELIEPKTAQNIVDCLKRIQSSIKFWTKKSGRKGYLEYVSKFI